MDGTIEPGRARDARLIEIANELFPRLTPVYVFIGLILLASAPFVGWWVVLPVIVDAIKAAGAHAFAARGRHVEAIYLIDHHTSFMIIGLAIFFAGGATSPFYPFLIIYAALFPLLFGERFSRLSLGLLVATAALTALGPAREIEHHAFFAAGTLICVIYALWVFGSEFTNSDLRHRTASRVDGLTGLANRRAFESDLKAVNEEVLERWSSAALILGDIDFFKRVNDQNGHAAGDRVLTEIAQELKLAFRSSDIAYRIGGEEFALIALSVSSELAEGMAEALRSRIELSYPAGIEVSMSFGVAMHVPGESTEQWFGRCDDALFVAKRAGRNRVEVADAKA